MYYLSILFSCLLLLSGCSGPRYSDFLPYTDDGELKPRVVFLPVDPVDDEAFSSRCCYFNESIRWLALDRNDLYFYSKEEVCGNSYAAQLSDPIKKAACYRPADFVVHIEVLEDAVKPSSETNVKSVVPLVGMRNRSVLCVKLRIQVIDIRCKEEKVILYEILEKSIVLPNTPCQPNVPTSIYADLACEAMNRIEDVIACSNH